MKKTKKKTKIILPLFLIGSIFGISDSFYESYEEKAQYELQQKELQLKIEQGVEAEKQRKNLLLQAQKRTVEFIYFEDRLKFFQDELKQTNILNFLKQLEKIIDVPELEKISKDTFETVEFFRKEIDTKMGVTRLKPLNQNEKINFHAKDIFVKIKLKKNNQHVTQDQKSNEETSNDSKEIKNDLNIFLVINNDDSTFSLRFEDLYGYKGEVKTNGIIMFVDYGKQLSFYNTNLNNLDLFSTEVIKNIEKGLSEQELLKEYKNKTIVVNDVYEDKEKQEKMNYLIEIFNSYQYVEPNLKFIKNNLELFDYIMKN